jgi:hypothetical protein
VCFSIGEKQRPKGRAHAGCCGLITHCIIRPTWMFPRIIFIYAMLCIIVNVFRSCSRGDDRFGAIFAPRLTLFVTDLNSFTAFL